MTMLLAALAPGVQAGSAKAAVPDVSASFNKKALADQLALSCTERTERRRQSMRPPFSPNTPPEYMPQGTQFLIKLQNMNSHRRPVADRIFKNLGDHIKDIAYINGVVYVFPHVVGEASPVLGDDPGYYNDAGLYIALERRAYIPFDKADITVAPDGKITVNKYIDSSRDRERMINHESGHMADDILGQFSLNSVGADGNSRLSNRQDYTDAFDSDMDALLASGRNGDPDVLRRGYYLPVKFKDKDVGGIQEDIQRVRREVFAELWAEANGHSPNHMSDVYPKAYKVVKSLNKFLKDMHDQAPVKCRYTQDGQAIPR
jgi:hypothetical protein